MTLTTTRFDWVRQLVHRESAIVLAPGKEYLVEARLLPVARTMGLTDVDQLVDTVRSRPRPDDTRRIVEALTTNETSWFRDGDPFTALTSTVLPALTAARGPAERLQIWSAACSSGQEAYTVAMLLEDALPNAASRVAITATDISREMVERTRAGRFSQLEVNRGLPASMLVRHFTRAGNFATPAKAMPSPRTSSSGSRLPRLIISSWNSPCTRIASSTERPISSSVSTLTAAWLMEQPRASYDTSVTVAPSPSPVTWTRRVTSSPQVGFTWCTSAS